MKNAQMSVNNLKFYIFCRTINCDAFTRCLLSKTICRTLMPSYRAALRSDLTTILSHKSDGVVFSNGPGDCIINFILTLIAVIAEARESNA